jgi:hypothetical protein
MEDAYFVMTRYVKAASNVEVCARQTSHQEVNRKASLLDDDDDDVSAGETVRVAHGDANSALTTNVLALLCT